MAELSVGELQDRIATGMREAFPMLDPFKSFDLARLAMQELGLADAKLVYKRAARAFALKEAEINGWEAPEKRPEHPDFEALLGERERLWREEVEAAVDAVFAARIEGS